jgi:hypothetical protein
MALKREMKITINKDGTFNIEVNGVPGPECLDFTSFLEEELGDVVERERSQEFYQEGEQTDHIHVGGNDND